MSESGTMIEKVAYAISEGLRNKRSTEELARAAIEAMIEPTEAMLAAGDSQMPLLEAPLTGRDVLADAWPDMIAAALSEDEGKGPANART